MFADRAKITICSGKGGDGHVSFRRELFVAAGGPDGGDGGKGGDVIFEVDKGMTTLGMYRHKHKFAAQPGENGGKSRCHGANGADIVLKVPEGTVIKEAESGKVIADMSGDNMRQVILKGGRGGLGNMHFATATMQVPKYAQPGKPAQELLVSLELKVIADVGLVGFPNVGKSTLINLLVGEKVAAIANKVQTTRTAIRGIVNRRNSQIIFTDTPGIHKPKTKLNETMVETSFTSLADADMILFLIEATSNEIGKGDKLILEKIKEAKRKTILIINKIDLVKKEKLLSLIELYRKEYPFEAVIPISATNPKYKDIILDEIEKKLKPGPAYYDIEEYTDQTLRQLAEEIIREKALKLLQDEVPHGIYVEVEKMKSRKNKKEEEIYDIEATIYCLRNSHKGIIIGKNGEMLKQIGRLARIDMEQNFGVKINLKTWVKVKEDWQENDNIVNRFKF